MAINLKQTSQFEIIRAQIEQHLYDSVLEIEKNIELALRSARANFWISTRFVLNSKFMSSIFPRI
ncbi:MAG: hypothetical protein A2504_02350 [Bdellovibrionales bacterium RIFOXYD12_FULL_39_22]|nr:MAG: hypothetical protein A2385_12380 [Bdellovibrionales bacterium RIFOXYB1_FULL_39_21]OFZ41146.1 MAG: hypothetical protein A2485_00790 [Bdellovibrionales bacterium RIFOXYC12_FULL_39_17]OFZ44900.1 MAG: hypothetical protein A2404_11535 [Bdellovibrionales bacterium RIFOXYC1_FULL_39_130]OFZ74347.1 MAG: hypothetical protein A2560_11905 [Bdellovibrionales bacterium RIFOXYD1_FULL_39_84]OFZ92349.1 MAG: hypothetical protein A2504_02350 [Bdellovibrionales bacterium RIFOXYD12_FULL_39_22]